MTKDHSRPIGISCLLVCIVCLFIAIERNNANAKKVNFINSMNNGFPIPGTLHSGKLKPAMPAATKYSLFASFLSGIGGIVFIRHSFAKNP